MDLFKRVFAPYISLFLFIIVTGIQSSSLAVELNLDEVLFGIEYTFQDAKIITEKGRENIRDNPYKVEKEREMAEAYAKALGLPQTAISKKTSWKQGYYIEVPNDGKFVVNAEPVTIEVNTTPRTYGEIIETAQPIFKAAESIKLVPYVQPAAERSGMGHYHIGGTSLGSNPFYIYPHLLRNMMMAYHKHPSLLWGFAEAFDIGPNSNIETYHYANREEEFLSATQEFDNSKQDHQALQRFMKRLFDSKKHLHHYRFINLEHFQKFREGGSSFDPSLDGKITVEFRTFRPPSSPEMAKAYAGLLISLMESMASEGYLEPSESIPADSYNLYHTVDYIRRDWERVKAKYKINDPLLEESIEEYFSIFEETAVPHEKYADLEILMAASPKEHKMKYLELRIKGQQTSKPQLKVEGQNLPLTWIEHQKGGYWVTFLDGTRPDFNYLEALKGRLSVDLNFASENGTAKSMGRNQNSSNPGNALSGGQMACGMWF